MSDSPPSDSQTPEHEPHDTARRRFERVVPVLIKKFLENAAGRFGEGPDGLRQLLGDLKLPKDALTLALTQLEETKNGLYRAVAREVREFLDNSNLSDELAKALTRLSFEIRTEIRFVPNDASGKRPSVHADTTVNRRPIEEAATSVDDTTDVRPRRSTTDSPSPSRAQKTASRDEVDETAARSIKEDLE